MELESESHLELMGLLGSSYTRLTRAINLELEQGCGLSLSWFDVLMHLGRSDSGHLTMTQLATNLSFTSGGLTRLVDRIVEAGLIERQNCPSDRRSIYVALTQDGEAMLKKATAIYIDGIQSHLLAFLTKEKQALLIELLSTIVANNTEGVCC